jgi:hypothetical protein
MALIDKINGRIGDLQAQRARIVDQAAAATARIDKSIAVLEEARAVVSPGLERALVKLQEIGLLTSLD